MTSCSFSTNPKSPAVVRREIDFTAIVANELSTSAAYVGFYPWGPAMQATTVARNDVLLNTFGRPHNWNYQHFFAVEDYLSYASPVSLVRAVDDFTFNAYAGNRGSGFTATAEVINGEVVGISFVDQGEGYVRGDLIPVETDHDVVIPAMIRVTDVSPTGGVTSAEIVEGGVGYGHGDTLTAGSLKIQVLNDEDFVLKIEVGCQGQLESGSSLNATYPTIIAKYPGTYGNALIFSSARASEFDNWEFAPLFGNPPAADTLEYDTEATQNIIPVDSRVLADWDDDWIVTINGVQAFEGTAPGTFSKLTTGANSPAIRINVAEENFSGNNEIAEFTLTNSLNLPTSNSRVEVDGVVVPQWSGEGAVPNGYVRVNGNSVTFGTKRATASGNGVANTFQLNFGQDEIDLSDLQVFSGGTFINTSTSAPTNGTAQATVSTQNGNNILTLTFHSTNTPVAGVNNIVARTGYIDSGSTITVSYGYPGEGSLKIFGNQTEVHAVVVDADGTFSGEAGQVLEAYAFMSLIEGNKKFDGSIDYYKNVINKQSAFVWVGSDIAEHTSVRLQGGTDSLLGTNSDLIAGWEKFTDPETSNNTYIIGGPADTVLANWIIDNILECRRDCFATFSPAFDDVVCNARNAVRNAIRWRKQIHSTSYAATEGNWKLRYDQYNDVYRWLPLSPDTLGIIAASNMEHGVWVSPAGTSRGRYKNYVRLAYEPNRAMRDELYPNDINPVYSVENIGATLFGDKTLIGRNSYFDMIGVRMLFIKVAYDITVASRDFFFERNNEFTRRRFFATINPYLRDLLGQGAYDDYRLIIDSTNNTPEMINKRFLCADIMIRPDPSINFIDLKLVNVKHGLSFEEVIQMQRVDTL